MNFDALNANLKTETLELLKSWLPGGKVQGKEYVCATIDGGKGESFSVNIKTGVWKEFAGDLGGADLVSLYAAIHHMTQGEAYLALGGLQDNQPMPSMIHPKHGQPSAHWCYKSKNGIPILYVARYELTEGKKTFLPWTMNGKGWICKNHIPPRPLYGLDLLAGRPSAPILICEGEKTTEAARTLAPDFVCITWSVGSTAWDKTDWSPIFGRSTLVLWPDADDPGRKAMAGIATHLSPRCGNIKILDVSKHSDGWDAADAVSEGMTRDELYEWIGDTPESTGAFSFKPESISELLSKPEPPIEWLIDSIWVDKSRGLIAGNPGVGKTWLALEMLISVATGQPCLGKYPVRQGAVLLLEEESSILNLSRRAHTMARGRGLKDTDLSHFFHITRQFIKIPQHERELIAYMKQREIKLVVFDSLRRFHGVDENSSEKMQPVLDSFARINIETSASIVLIHHLSKLQDKSSKGVFERLRGTSDLWAWRDCLIGMEGEEEAETATCSFQFRDAESTKQIQVNRVIDDETGAVTLKALDMTESPEFVQKTVAATEFITTQYGSAFLTDVAKALDGRKSDNLKAIKLMVKRGILVTLTDGKIGVPK